MNLVHEINPPLLRAPKVCPNIFPHGVVQSLVTHKPEIIDKIQLILAEVFARLIRSAFLFYNMEREEEAALCSC